jgi:hypothetical protein
VGSFIDANTNVHSLTIHDATARLIEVSIANNPRLPALPLALKWLLDWRASLQSLVLSSSCDSAAPPHYAAFGIFHSYERHSSNRLNELCFGPRAVTLRERQRFKHEHAVSTLVYWMVAMKDAELRDRETSSSSTASSPGTDRVPVPLDRWWRTWAISAECVELKAGLGEVWKRIEHCLQLFLEVQAVLRIPIGTKIVELTSAERSTVLSVDSERLYLQMMACKVVSRLPRGRGPITRLSLWRLAWYPLAQVLFPTLLVDKRYGSKRPYDYFKWKLATIKSMTTKFVTRYQKRL